MNKKITVSLETVKDPNPNVTAEIVAKMQQLAAEGYFVFHMTLHQILSCGIDTHDWERDRQN